MIDNDKRKLFFNTYYHILNTKMVIEQAIHDLYVLYLILYCIYDIINHSIKIK